MTEHKLLIPFLDKSKRYCRGVELGMNIIAPMLRQKRVIKGYFQSLNEEQIRLSAQRMGYSIDQLKPWRFDGRATGWVWMLLRRIK